MDTRIYRSLLAPFLESHTSYHHDVPCHNLVCLEKLIEVSENPRTENFEPETGEEINYFGKFPFHQSFKYETDSCTVLYPGWTKIDKAHNYVFRKLLWYKKLMCHMPEDINKSIRQLKKQKLSDTQVVDRKLFKFLQWLSFEQYDNFVGNYNWLYTGGNIAGFKYNNEYWLITPDEFKQSTFLCVTKVNPEFSQLQENNMRPLKVNLYHNQPVFQITSRPFADEIFFAVRHKNWISIKKLDYNCKMMDVWDLQTFKRGPRSNYVTTCDLSQDCRYLSLVGNDSDTVVFNIEVGMPVFSSRQQWDFMQWSRVLFNNIASEVYFADGSCFKIFDLRANNKANFMYQPTVVTNKCEKICNFFGSELRENIFYIATSHSLIEVDIRTGKNLQRWTHLMGHAPQFGGTSRRGDKELIILQSRDSSELIGIRNEGLRGKFACSKSSPYLFSTVSDELIKAHLNGFGLHEKIRQRLSFNVTGLHMAMSSEGVDTVFTVNGGGDVVMTKLKIRKPDDMKKMMDCYVPLNSQKGFEKFETRCCNQQTADKCEYRTTPLSYIDFCSLLPAFERVNAKEGRRRKRFKGLRHYWPNSEMYSPEILSYREGSFYERFLPYWGIKLKSVEDEEDTSGSGNENKDENTKESRAKVEAWMVRREQ